MHGKGREIGSICEYLSLVIALFTLKLYNLQSLRCVLFLKHLCE